MIYVGFNQDWERVFVLCAFSLLPHYGNCWLQPPRGVKRYNSPSKWFIHWFFFSLQWDLLSIVLCVRNTGWTRRTRSTISWNVNSGKVVTHKRQIYKDGLRLLNVMRKIKQGAAIKQELHHTLEDWGRLLEKVKSKTWKHEWANHAKFWGAALQTEGTAGAKVCRQDQLDISGGRNLDKSGQCS